MTLKSLKRSKKPNRNSSMIDLTYDYVLAGGRGKFLTLQKYNPRDEPCTTVRALMRQARLGDKSSRRVLRWIIKAMLEKIDGGEGNPDAHDRDLIQAFEQHWAELVADGLPSKTPAERTCRGYIAAADRLSRRLSQTR